LTNHKKVIVLPKPREKPAPWRFYVIKYPNGTQPVDDWAMNDLSDAARFALNDALKEARKIDEMTDWLCFKRRMRGGDLAKHKVFELRFQCGDKREYRLLGVVGEQRKQVVFLMGCYHKGRAYTPANALETTAQRAKDLKDRKVAIYERKIRTDW
jgi:hypothetical protein